MLNGLIGNGGTPARTEFDKYLTAYTAGHYVINRDWQTELQGSANALDGNHAAVKAFTDARAALNDNTKYPNDTNIFYGQGTNIPIGGGNTVALQLTRMEDEMARRITERFGLTGANAANMKDVARALVIQLGQDLPELKAFFADMTAEPTIDHEGRLGRTPAAYIHD
jgi:tagatose-1,6-bisphosphate aldolase non-catalytic subunit AgaZ/GatZ